MMSFEERLQTFAEWPKDVSTKPQALAEAGFSFAGPFGKKYLEVRCAECYYSIAFHERHVEVDPWEYHALRYPPCSFVVAEKGDEFVARRQRMAKKSCPDPETPKPSDCGHCSAKTDQLNPQQYIFGADDHREAVRASLVTNNTGLKRVSDQKFTVPHKKAKYLCVKCDKTYSRRYYLKKHIADKHEYPKTCENCSESFNNQSSLSKHQKTCGKSASAKIKTGFTCPQCSKIYFTESVLQKHIKTQHERNDKICLTRGEIFTAVSNFKNHKETCGNDATSVTDGDDGLAQGNLNLGGKGKPASAKPPQNPQTPPEALANCA